MLKVLSDTSIRPTLAERVVSIQLQPVAVVQKPFFFRRRLRPSESLKFSVGRILESDILGIAVMDCNDGNVKGFVGYKYPTYSCCLSEINAWATSAPLRLLKTYSRFLDGVCAKRFSDDV